jgi:hypothetical protein
MIRRTFFVMTKLVPIISSQYFSMQKTDGHPTYRHGGGDGQSQAYVSAHLFISDLFQRKSASARPRASAIDILVFQHLQADVGTPPRIESNMYTS